MPGRMSHEQDHRKHHRLVATDGRHRIVLVGLVQEHLCVFAFTGEIMDLLTWSR